MPFKLQKVAAGLLGLLDQKVGGKTPEVTSELLSPVVELADHYGLPDRELVEATANISAAQAVVSFTVPDGEIWRVHGVGTTQAVLAADAVRAHFEFSIGGMSLAFGAFAAAAAAAGDIVASGVLLRPCLLLRSGTTVLLQLDSAIASGNRVIALNALIDRIQA